MENARLKDIDEQFIEDCARSLLAVHGADAERFIAAQIAILAGRLDIRAIETWQCIRRKVGN